jgi:hypothetical protein
MDSEIIYVPVPRQWLSQIYRRLGDLSDSLGTDQGFHLPTPLDDAMVARIYAESEEPQRRMMRLMAEHADEWRYSSELAADLQLAHGPRGLAGMLGAFGRRAKHRYGGNKPWQSEWDSAREEARYMMSAEIAGVIMATAQAL